MVEPTADGGSTAGREGSRTLRRGLAVLAHISRNGAAGTRLVDICRATGLGRPTVYRLLATLIETGFVDRRDRFRYLPGPAFGGLALAPPGDLADRLAPALAEISDRTADSAFAIVRVGDDAHCIARHIGRHAIQILAVEIGNRQPMGVGAAGLALLAALPDSDVTTVVSNCGPRLSRYGGMSPTRLAALVEATRQRGWSVVGNHAVAGVLGVGVAVLDVHGRPVAAISVATLVERMPRQRQAMVAQWIREVIESHFPDGMGPVVEETGTAHAEQKVSYSDL